MNTRRFVSGSSVILAGWLGATFLNEVPSQRYPKLDKTPPTAALNGDMADEAMLTAQAKPAVLSISISR